MTVHRSYDHANRLTDITDWLNNNTHFTYDADGNITGQTLPPSTSTKLSFSYDAADSLKEIIAARSTGSNPFRWTFGYGRDPLGQVTGSTDREAGMRHSYSYDQLNRLTQDLRANRAAASWTFDATNNLRTVQDTASNITKTLTYDANSNQLTGMQTTGSVSQNLGFSYNGNGDRTSTTDLNTSSTVNSYGYNQADQLTSFTQGSTSATYAYDGDGLRASKTVNGTPEAFTWDIVEGMPLIIQDGSTKYITGPDGLPLEQIDGSGNVLYYVQDQLGSTRGLIDGSGNVQGTYTYGAYGDLAGHSGTASTPFGYAGQYADAESGLVYMRARYYDPATAQFSTVDPAVDATLQPYAYAGGNPANAADPLGLCDTPIICGVGDAFSGIVGAGSTVMGALDTGNNTYEGLKRQALILALKNAGDFIGQAHDDLVSGDPGRTVRGLFNVVTTVGVPEFRGARAAGEGCQWLVSLVDADRAEHIIWGERLPNGNFSGGHLWPGNPTKTPFPKGWSPERILHEVSDVATDPYHTVLKDRGIDRVVEGMRAGVRIRVVIRRGKIWTAFPTNLRRNP